MSPDFVLGASSSWETGYYKLLKLPKFTEVPFLINKIESARSFPHVCRGDLRHEPRPLLRKRMGRGFHFTTLCSSVCRPFHAICTPMHKRINAITRKIPWTVWDEIFCVIFGA